MPLPPVCGKACPGGLCLRPPGHAGGCNTGINPQTIGLNRPTFYSFVTHLPRRVLYIGIVLGLLLWSQFVLDIIFVIRIW